MRLAPTPFDKLRANGMGRAKPVSEAILES
jgi:hypothetical protein